MFGKNGKIIKLPGVEETIQRPGVTTQKIEIVVETDTVAKTVAMKFRSDFVSLAETVGIIEMAKATMLGGSGGGGQK